MPKASTSVSPRNYPDFEYVKEKNIELTKELAEMRKDRTMLQSDMNHLLREKFELEIKCNRNEQIIQSIDRRSKICLNKLIELSNELYQIIQLTSINKEVDARSASSGTPQKKNSTNVKQVVTPHAVNGHVIHTPTIRITRYNESPPQVVEVPYNDTDEQHSQNETSDRDANEGDNNEDSAVNEEDPGSSTFRTRGGERRCLDRQDLLPLLQLEQNAAESFDDEESDSSTEDDILEESGALSVIREDAEEEIESNQSGSEENPDVSVYSDRFKQLKVFLDPIPNAPSCNGYNFQSDSDGVDSSVTVETSTSFDGTSRFNDTSLSNSHNKLVSVTSQRKSIAQRKSIGSPIPPKISSKVNIPGRHSRSSTSLSYPNTSTIYSSRDSTESAEDSTLKPSRAETMSEEVDSSIAHGTSMESFSRKTSIHSTPMIFGDQTQNSSVNDKTISPVGRRKPRKKVVPSKLDISRESLDKSLTNFLRPIVKLERLDTSREGTEEIPKKCNQKSRSTIRNSNKPKSSCSNDENQLISVDSKRPKRAAKPTSLKEPNLCKKLRRSR